MASATRYPPKKGHVDLHMHSSLSDGELSVPELIDYCRLQGLDSIAITDHDNIDAYEEGREYAAEAGIEFISGVEISSYWEGDDIHILGYLYEPTHLRLNRTLLTLRERRRERAREIVRRLAERGVEIRYEKLQCRTQGGSIGRAHIAAALVEEEYVGSFQEAFLRYLGNDTDLMRGIDSERLAPEEAIRLILEAGGVPVLAHPSKTNRDDLLEALVEYGLKGIEIYCHGHNATQFRRYRDLARHYGLACCGGADFHLKRGDDRFSPGSLNVPCEALYRLKDIKESLAA